MLAQWLPLQFQMHERMLRLQHEFQEQDRDTFSPAASSSTIRMIVVSIRQRMLARRIANSGTCCKTQSRHGR